MLKKELKTALMLAGIAAPFAVQADQAMSNQANQKPMQSYLPGEMVRDGQMPAGYNQTASYVADGGWDVFFTGDFIYWHLSQDATDIGTVVKTTSAGVAGIVNGSGTSIGYTPSYKPGFQVGMGFNMRGMDNWAVYGEYTWYQNKSSKSVTLAADEVFVASPGLLIDRVLTAGSATGTLNYHYNNAFFGLERAFYMGKKLTANFGFGLRGLWISQHSSSVASALSYVGYTQTTLVPESGTLTVSNDQKSWALGPRMMLDTDWLLGYGFRLTGEVAGSVLYTRYTEDGASAVEGTFADYGYSNAPFSTLRGITEMSMGLAWGAYFGDNNDYHFDIGAAYDFDVYWNQNLDIVGSPGNTYIHGLNASLRIDF